MIRTPHNNINRVQAWVSRRQPGEKFLANTIAKELNLSTTSVGSVLKWQENIEKDSNQRSIWVKI